MPHATPITSNPDPTGKTNVIRRLGFVDYTDEGGVRPRAYRRSHPGPAVRCGARILLVADQRYHKRADVVSLIPAPLRLPDK